MTPTHNFTGFRCTYYTDLSPGPLKKRADLFLSVVNWDHLCVYASAQRNGINCVLLPNIGLGYNHMVRILEFTDAVRWIARLRLPSLTRSDSDDATESMISEYITTSLVESTTMIPVPRIHAVESEFHPLINARFMLMDCLEGNVGMDLGMQVPSEHKASFFAEMARIHVFARIELSKTRLPMIGTINGKNSDGTFIQGPMRGIGGPFRTAGEYFHAWAENAKFGMDKNLMHDSCGSYADEIIPSINSFLDDFRKLAEKLSICNEGPFPLCHGDFGHNNIIVDDNYKVLGVIDWESAFAAPWEVFASFPLTLSATPPKMDAPWNYDDDGNPADEELRQKCGDREVYIAAVAKVEAEEGMMGELLISKSLRDERRQHLIDAMRLFENGKPGWYGKLIDEFWKGDEKT